MPIAAKPRDNELRDWVEISLSPRVPDAKARGTPIIEFFASAPPCQHQVFDFVVDASLTEMREFVARKTRPFAAISA
jgi:hypothetical protein